MQEISTVLINARKAKGVDLDQVVRDTNISKMFLEGLENDNYKDFPAETYVLGFLRNYAVYLDLDAEQVVKLYKQTRLQESEIPQEVILNKKVKKSGSLLPILVPVAALALVGVGFLVWKFVFSSSSHSVPQGNENTSESNVTVITENTSQHYDISEGHYEKRLHLSDTFTYTLNEVPYLFKVSKINSQLELETENLGTQIIKLADTVQFDLNNDTIVDIDIHLADINPKDSSQGVLLVISTGSQISAKTDVSLETNQTQDSYLTVFESANAYPVTMNITFRNNCFFRYEIDRGTPNATRSEMNYQRNARLSIRAENSGFRIWASNGNAVKIELVGAGRTVELELTRPGEVIVQDIKWIRDEKGFRFVVMNVE